MLARREQDSTKVLKPWAIELKHCHGRPSGRRETKNERCVVAPGEMIVPKVLSRMIQKDWLSGEGVGSFRSIVFVVVAPLAGRAEVLP
jgi:hypothetical protein